MKLLSFFTTITVVVIAIFLNQGCGKSSATQTTQNYQGPGSKWSATLNTDGTFVITKAPSVSAAVELTVNGTYTRLSTGFVKLTVTSASGTGAPAAGVQAYGLEIPGFAFLLKPAGSGEKIIPMVASGSCPTTDFNANWIIVEAEASKAADGATNDWYGTFNYSTSGVASVATKYALSTDTVLAGGAQTLPASTCSSGILSIGAPENVDIFLTTANGAIVHTQNHGQEGFILAMPQGSFATPSVYAGNYGGLVFNGHNSGDSGGADDRIQPIAVTITAGASSLSGTGARVTNVETGDTDPQGATISLTDMDLPSAGFVRGTITITGKPARPLRCMGKSDINGSGKNMLFCIGESPDDTTKHFNLLMVSK